MKQSFLIKYLLIILISVFMNSTSLSQNSSMQFISVEGNKFVNENDETIIFRGVSVADPARLNKLDKWNEDLFVELKNWNVNIVRFPVHPTAWNEIGEDNYLKLLDDGVKWAKGNKMYIIIDWHTIGNLRTELFMLPMYNTTKTETFRFWKTIASRYKGNPTVAFYDFLTNRQCTMEHWVE